jgi:hypothetical protein
MLSVHSKYGRVAASPGSIILLQELNHRILNHYTIAVADLALAAADLSVAASLLSVVLIAADFRSMLVWISSVLPSLPIAFGLSHAQASLLTAAPEARMGLVAVPAPWLARRFGRGRVILAALLLFLAASGARVLSAFASTILVSTHRPYYGGHRAGGNRDWRGPDGRFERQLEEDSSGNPLIRCRIA